eukprot:TRINITY_DN2745_c0_g1_i1.p1 TRINITY_DN2745_c0_g1~~TRINITY_DN2745_c0_g1_i1.p1  ORF type:complete len:583 (+),score=178.61 TRINITY_DN2745_c0_g1_i1:62-1810(+)
MPEQRGDFSIPEAPSSVRMTNEDFRKLMMTPRSSGSSGSLEAPSTASSSSTPGSSSTSVDATKGKRDKVPTEVSERRKKKKSYYAKLKKAEDDKMAELAAKYRDRAAERRDGVTNPAAGAQSSSTREEETPSATSGYRAVAPDVKSSYDAAERRRQTIQESKFLGGDMEHTHLVKGLDFALLQKVRSEIFVRETEEVLPQADEEEDDAQAASSEAKDEAKEPGDPVLDLINGCKTSISKNLLRTLFRPELSERNEFFLPGRMAYIIDLDEEFAESDIPTTTIRSKVDCMANVSQQATLSTNDIVINKLTQILSYLRAGSRNKKKKKDRLREEKTLATLEMGKKGGPGENIFQDAGEYELPVKDDREHRGEGKDRKDDRKTTTSSNSSSSRRYKDEKRHGSRWDDRERKPRSYFEKSEKDEKDHEGGLSGKDKEFITNLMKKESEKSAREGSGSSKNLEMMSKKEPEGYAECYPGLVEMNDAIDDSDDEVDYSKMDLGNKKGPVGRWDFDTQEEYADYMGRKEALPKAAFQYGVKMAEGRKTRGKVGAKNERAKFDKEWNKISAILDKRKSHGSASKKAKYDD